MVNPSTSPLISAVRFTDTNLIVSLSDGREISTPLSWYPQLALSSEGERDYWEISPFGIHWPKLDEDLSLEGMLSGRPLVARVPPKLESVSGPSRARKNEQKRSFAYGNLVTDDEIPPPILNQLDDEIETSVDDL